MFRIRCWAGELQLMLDPWMVHPWLFRPRFGRHVQAILPDLASTALLFYAENMSPEGLSKPFFEDSSYQEEYFTTFDLKQRGWTATMIKKLLPDHDAEKKNFMRIPTRAGRRRLDHPVKLYEQDRVKYLEDTEEFYLLYENAQKALARGEKRRETVLEQKRQKLEAAIEAYSPAIDVSESWPVNLRRHRATAKALKTDWMDARIPEDLIDEALSRLKEVFRMAYHQVKHPGKKIPHKKKPVEDDDW